MKNELNYFSAYLTIIALLLFNTCYSQKFDFQEISHAFNENDFNKVDSLLNNVNQEELIDIDKANLFFLFSEYYFSQDKYDKAYEYILSSKDLFIKLNVIEAINRCNTYIFKISAYSNIKINIKNLIKETKELALKYGDSITLKKVYGRIAADYIQGEKGELAIRIYKNIIPLAIGMNDSLTIGACYDNISLSYDYTSPPILDSSLFYNRLAEKYFIQSKQPNRLLYNYNNRAMIYKYKEDYVNAISFLLKADSITTFENIITDKILIYENLISCYEHLSNYEKQVKYFKLLNKLRDSLNAVAQNISIAEIQEKYDNEKLRANKFEIEAQMATSKLNEKIAKNQKNTILVGGAIVLCIIVLAGSLSLKNSRRKRLLALQEKELETQKNLTLLKEQEILAINAMVEGQEKERKRVAEDLHDNLGSVIATLKLHFDNLRVNRKRKKVDQETLFNKTENLIDEAYQKVRNIAHAKNAGVIANQGLLVAVKLMAEKVSSANTIQIEVIDHGLEKPLENSLEIALFRIIQELTTNIIKHAQANEATINISQDEEDIMVIIEDNGIGMNASQIDLNKGMGLHSIKTRVEHLEGSFTIDSTPTKGTTIIIQIPS